MRKILLVFVVATGLYAQGVPSANHVWTAATSVPFGAQANLLSLPNATITVCLTGVPPCSLVSLFSDQALTQSMTNPFKTDAKGGFQIYAAPGYKVTSQTGQLVATVPFIMSGPNGLVASYGPNAVQTVAQPAGTSFNVNILNGDYQADQFCSTPGTLDDTCIQNAINAITHYGQIQVINSQNFRVGKIYVPRGQYQWRTGATVTIPAFTQIQIEGWSESNWGTAFLSDGTASRMFQVNSNSFGISNIFWKCPTGLANAIFLGSSSNAVFDSHINWNWFQGFAAAITPFNYSGGDFSHNTAEQGSAFVHSSVLDGATHAADLIIDDLRAYHNANPITIFGDDTANFSNIQISNGIFDFNNGGSSTNAAIVIQHAIAISIIGTNFNNNTKGDITLGSVAGGGVFSTTHYNSGGSPITFNRTVGLSATGVSIHNCGTNSALAAPTAGVLVIGSFQTQISAINGIADSGMALCTNGINVDSRSQDTSIGQTSLAISTGANITNADKSSNFSIPILRVMTSVAAGSGLQHMHGALGCTTAASVGAECSTSALRWSVPFNDTNYTVTCSLEGTTGAPVLVNSSKTAASFELTIYALTATAATGSYDCIGMHN
jgi:hypothetical protein